MYAVLRASSSAVVRCIIMGLKPKLYFFFFNDTATTEIYTLSLHDALPIFDDRLGGRAHDQRLFQLLAAAVVTHGRSEEHTSELQSHLNLVCRLLLEKKKNATQCGKNQVHNLHNSLNLLS